jgi:hypothetical protein
MDSKSFIAAKDTILAVLNFCRKDRSSIVMGHQHTHCNHEPAKALNAKSPSCFSTGLSVHSVQFRAQSQVDINQ